MDSVPDGKNKILKRNSHIAALFAWTERRTRKGGCADADCLNGQRQKLWTRVL